MSRTDDSPTIVAAEFELSAGHPWTRIPLFGLIVGVIGSIAAIAMARGNTEQFYFSWLVAFMFFLSIALGGLFFVLVHFATKAGWSVAVRRIAENAMATLPLFLVLFVPIVLGLKDLFHWTHLDAVAHDPLLQSKAPFLNTSFFLIRALVYFASWTVLSVLFSRQSRQQDRTGDHGITRRLQAVSAPAIAVFALTTTFAAIDWMMTLDPHWYSTMFGVYYFSGCLVGIYAFVIIVATFAQRAGLFRGMLSSDHFHDLGKLLYAFTVFWAYIAFSQYFLIWYGNIPEETLWYIHRLEGSWREVSILLALGHFVVPFFFLMREAVKRRPMLLVAGAFWMLLMHLLDIYWLVMPTLHDHGARFGMMDIAALVAVGGFFLAGFGWGLTRSALIPVRDPRLPESLSARAH